MAHARGKPVDDLTGQYFGGYKLEELVGTGGMASIYKGFDETLSRWVAIKVVPVQASGGTEEVLLARFRQEARAIAALRHRNILTIYSYGEVRTRWLFEGSNRGWTTFHLGTGPHGHHSGFPSPGLCP